MKGHKIEEAKSWVEKGYIHNEGDSAFVYELSNKSKEAI